MKAKRGHQDRAQAQLCAFERGFDETESLLVFHLRELDDEDGVLRGETDEHDEADLRVDVVFVVPDHQCGEGAPNRDRQTRAAR